MAINHLRELHKIAGQPHGRYVISRLNRKRSEDTTICHRSAFQNSSRALSELRDRPNDKGQTTYALNVVIDVAIGPYNHHTRVRVWVLVCVYVGV